MADLTNIPLSSFIASNKKENCTIEVARNVAKLMGEIGCPVSSIYALSGSVTASLSAMEAEYGKIDFPINLYFSVDSFDADADQIEYVAPVSDLNCGLLSALCKDGPSSFNSILALAARYGQTISAKPGYPPFDSLDTVLNSPHFRLGNNDISQSLLDKYGF